MYVPRGNPKLCNVSRTVVRHKYTRVQAKVHTGTTRASESFHPKLQPQETVASNHRKKQKKQVRNPELLCNLPRPHPTCGQTPAPSLSSNATSSPSRTSKDGKEEEEAEENERAFETPGPRPLPLSFPARPRVSALLQEGLETEMGRKYGSP